ncbi:transcriptional regulator with AbiEi antitoxin N-terminal domain [Cyclonatronum proteinivorum]|uniref:Transcriptional regulator with AbiEi antitoxin N-terminal domain n=1 Tax=Cyclonatronum proteinivorum TaxID=1457365 RepID=A0A345UKA0_9BACT|nr:type IV toxin-antitoxin system AbiEi family antitoxin [Cyclonatronum proteinivorum]AXJ00902.1 transcriptional regulator with AbiEi antitoxin N-terminal domain [Cyclonatronum proteinivorum]
MAPNQRNTKLNKLLSGWKEGMIYTSPWLSANGYTPDMLFGYKKSNWVKSIGTGAFMKTQDEPLWEGAVHALQHQLGYAIHVGGETALELHGVRQNISPRLNQCHLYTPSKRKLPAWFTSYDWQVDIKLHISTLFKGKKLGVQAIETASGIPVLMSEPERAIMELLSHVNSKPKFIKAWELTEGMMTLRPALVQRLLTDCTSVKVKRLFLFMAETHGLPWYDKLKVSEIDLGSGKRTIVKNGKLNSTFEITVPKEVPEVSWT